MTCSKKLITDPQPGAMMTFGPFIYKKILSDMLSCPESPPPSYESTVSLPNFQKSTTSLDNSNSEVISKQPVSLFTLATVSTKCLPGLDSLAVTDHLV